ncbi:putative mucin/carbohydrate-binding domain-containing protein [Spiroplasma poulsonii]|uniref:putative mucin/carbohydrate-binding domain-containing protein n=1 Tax=Spiroplasma poulsonii TaxID=2138 RepID=UPI001F4C7D29|nr:putative mucin/carbohydrate-binding domain-containing protein [Spiroplasma poulsonii]UNF62117.1 hypothetical protein MNU24_01240 [Spiroplasma poulsonii]
MDKNNKKIRLYGDAEIIHSYFGDKDPPYYRIIISNQNGIILYDLKILGTDNFLNVIRTNNLWNEISYDENYLITLELQEASRVLKFNSLLNDWTAVSTTNKVTKKYQIINNKLIEVN